MKTMNLCAICALAGCAVASIPRPVAASDWLQFGYDAQHDSNNVDETSIAANLGSVQQLYQTPLPAVADGAPVYLSGAVTSSGIFDLLFSTTEDGHLVAMDANTGEILWSQQAATGPAPKTNSSPAIDPNRQFVYSFGLDGKVHKYTIFDGSETVDANWPEVVTLKPDVEKGSSALTFAQAGDGHTYLFATTSNVAYDGGDYQGHIVSIDLASGAQSVFNTLCSDQPIHFDSATDCGVAQSGIWTRPAATYDANTDRIFVTTGNGPYTGNVGGTEWAQSVLALSPSLLDTTSSPLAKPLDSYTPSEFDTLSAADLDLGVSAVTILPAPSGSKIANLGVQIGKDAVLRLLDLSNLNSHGAPGFVDGDLSEITAPDYFGFTSNQAAVWIDPASNVVWYLIACEDNEYGYMLGVLNGRPRLVQAWSRDVGGAGGSPVVANGIEFVVEQHNIVGLDPHSGVQVWSMPITGVHWASPIVVDGKIFLADGNATMSAYGVANAATQSFSPTAPNVQKVPGYVAPFKLPVRADAGQQ